MNGLTMSMNRRGSYKITLLYPKLFKKQYIHLFRDNESVFMLTLVSDDLFHTVRYGFQRLHILVDRLDQK